MIDHVNLAQPWQHFDEAVLFYTSALALEPQPFAEVPSPSGLVRSQVMLTADRAVRLVLNLAPLIQQDGRRRHGRPTRSTSPSPWTTWWPPPGTAGPADWSSCRSRRTTTRTWTHGSAWTPDFLATLQDLNLLYDRDADGEFLHFYTATVGSVFFEMVERRGSYDGYGAPNAPVRHAVQYDLLHRPDPPTESQAL